MDLNALLQHLFGPAMLPGGGDTTPTTSNALTAAQTKGMPPTASQLLSQHIYGSPSSAGDLNQDMMRKLLDLLYKGRLPTESQPMGMAGTPVPYGKS